MATVLIVDDEQATLDLLTRVVRLLGHEPIPVLGGAQAIAALEQSPPDIVLLDLMMPELDGYTTMRRIRSLKPGRDLPIVVVTASQELDLETRVAAAGGDEVLKKPINMDMINLAIQRHTRSTVVAESGSTMPTFAA